MNLSNYIGIPFEQLDCYALTRLFYRQEFGIELEDFGLTCEKESEKGFFSKVAINYKEYCAKWIEVDKPCLGDVIALKWNLAMPNFVTHFAIAVSSERMIHTSYKTGSILDNISRYTRVIGGVYRHANNYTA